MQKILVCNGGQNSRESPVQLHCANIRSVSLA